MDATERVPPLCVVAPRWRTGRLRRQDATERVPCDRVVVEASGRGRHLFPTSFCVRRSRILCVLVKKNARRHGGIAIVRVPRYAPERDSGLSGPADCGRISVFGLKGGRMKRFFRRAGCAPPDDSRRRGVVLCHSVDGHMPSTTTRRGCWLCVCVVDGPGGMETPGVPSPQRTAGTGRRESQRGSGNVRICVFGFD